MAGASLMQALFAIGVGVLVSTGLWLVLDGRRIALVLGLGLLSQAVNLLVFAMGRLPVDQAPLVSAGQHADTLAALPDPLPQALVLTAIVIGLGMTAVLLAILVAEARGRAARQADLGQPADREATE